MDKNYWSEFWKNTELLKYENPQNQVGRSKNRVPITQSDWEETLDYIEKRINLQKTDTILDLCAGNGLISIPFAEKCNKVYSVDISPELLKHIDSQKYGNIVTQCGDIRYLQFEPGTFNKVIINAGVQYITDKELIALLEQIYTWLKPGGLVYIGDIPDYDKIWSFHDTFDRQKAYIESVKNDQPIIGTWFTRSFIEVTLKVLGYGTVDVSDQPPKCINRHYRFEVVAGKNV